LALARVSYFGGPMEYDYWKRFMDASYLISQEMFLNLPCMKELNPSDQVGINFSRHAR
jgi:hypothetical protein